MHVLITNAQIKRKTLLVMSRNPRVLGKVINQIDPIASLFSTLILIIKMSCICAVLVLFSFRLQKQFQSLSHLSSQVCKVEGNGPSQMRPSKSAELAPVA